MTQVNKNDDGTLISQKAVFKNNIASAIDAFDDIRDPPMDCILIAYREKRKDDCNYGIAVMPARSYDVDLISVKLTGFDAPPIIISHKTNLLNTIENVCKRVLTKLLLLA